MFNLGKVNINLLTKSFNFVPNVETINELKKIKNEFLKVIEYYNKINHLQVGKTDDLQKIKRRLKYYKYYNPISITNILNNINRLNKILNVLESNKYDDEKGFVHIERSEAIITIPSLAYQLDKNSFDVYLRIESPGINTDFFVLKNKLCYLKPLKKRDYDEFLCYFRIYLDVKDRYGISFRLYSLKDLINHKISNLFENNTPTITNVYNIFSKKYLNFFKSYGIDIKQDVPILLNGYYNISDLEFENNNIYIKVITEKSYINFLQKKDPYEKVELKHFISKTLGTNANNINLIYETISKLNFKQEDIIITNDNNIIHEAINFSEEGCNRLEYTANRNNVHFTPDLLGTYYNLLGYKVYYIKEIVRCLLRDCYLYYDNRKPLTKKTVAIRNYYLNASVKQKLSARVRLDQKNKGYHLLGIDEQRDFPLFMYYHLPLEGIFKIYLENINLFISNTNEIITNKIPDLKDTESLYLSVFYSFLNHCDYKKNIDSLNTDNRIINRLLPVLDFSSPYIDAITSYNWKYECMFYNFSEFKDLRHKIQEEDPYLKERERENRKDYVKRILNVFIDCCKLNNDVDVDNILKNILNRNDRSLSNELFICLNNLVNEYINNSNKKENQIIVNETIIEEKPTLKNIIYKPILETQEVEEVEPVDVVDAIVEELDDEEVEEYLNRDIVVNYNNDLDEQEYTRLIRDAALRAVGIQAQQVTRRLEAQENNNIVQNIQQNGIN